MSIMFARVETLLPRVSKISVVGISTLPDPTTAGSTAARLTSFLVHPALETHFGCCSHRDIGLKDNNT